jgi:hypothetical protein
VALRPSLIAIAPFGGNPERHFPARSFAVLPTPDSQQQSLLSVTADTQAAP